MADESGTGPERRPGPGRPSDGDPAGRTLFQPSLATPSHDAPSEPDGPWSRHETQAWLPVLDGRSPNEWVCPFLRSIDDDDRVGTPVEAPDPANRCAALREPVPQSLRQQELVCLTSGHVNCPRYLRGAIAVTESPPPTVRIGRALSPAILGSAAVLVLAFSASVAFVVARGGLDLTPTATPSATVAAVVSSTEPSQQPSLVPTVEPSISEVPTTAPTPAASPVPTLAPSPSPTAVTTPAATPEATPSPVPSSDRYALLEPCPDAPDCWIYRVRSGDNLASIANYFGVSLESIYDRNPWARTTSLRAGQELRLPPPTR